MLRLRAAPSPEQQQQQRQPPRRCQAITCLIPVGKLTPSNFSRSSPQEVARTRRRVRGARVRTRSPGAFPPSPSFCRPHSQPLSRPRILSARLASLLHPPTPPPPTPRGTGPEKGLPPNSDQSRPDLQQCPRGAGAKRRQSRSSALCPPVSPAIPARGCGAGSTPGSLLLASHSPRGNGTAARAQTACRTPCRAEALEQRSPGELRLKSQRRQTGRRDRRQTSGGGGKASKGQRKKWWWWWWWWASWPWRRLSPAP